MDSALLHPPMPAPHLTIAVAGRDVAAGQEPALRTAATALLSAISGWRGAGQPVAIALLSRLAPGSDQIAAQAALDLGLEIDAVLPVAAAEYRAGFDDTARFDALLGRARRSWALPHHSAEPGGAAFALAGSLMLGQATILIALGDKGPGTASAETAALVDEAIRRGMPVIDLPATGPAHILWARFDGIGTGLLTIDSVPSRPLDGDHMTRVLDTILAPPASPDERRALAAYLGERERRLRLRVEYTLLLAAIGIRPLSRSMLRVGRYHETTRAEWLPFHNALDSGGGVSNAFHGIERAFSWADRLADHYAQIYRSGTVLNYLFAALSVVTALIGLLAPAAKPVLIALEVLFTAALILNTWAGNRLEWHRRWLDYRYLAEQLRLMRSLKLLGAAWTGDRAHARTLDDGRWTDWYAAAVWRQMGLPPTIGHSATLRTLVDHVVTHEIEPQIAYNAVNAHRMERLDHRLHLIGTALFVATLLSSLVGLVGYLFDLRIVEELGKLPTVLSAALPTLGAALFGIRGQSDFAAAARRSIGTSAALQRSVTRLRDPLDLITAASLVEDVAQTMAADLGEWHTTFQDRKLAIPS